MIELHRVGDEVVAQHRRHTRVARALVARRRMIGEHLARGREPEAHVEATQREPLDEPLDLRQLRALGAQELAPRRHVEEQVAHLDRRAVRMRVRRGSRQGAVDCGNHVRRLGVARARDHPHARHGRDARQRLAAEAQRAHRLEVVDAADLAGGVAGQGEQQLVRGDADAVVAHAAELGAALLHLDVDRQRARVEAVLDQFLDHGRRALDHLAGGDLVNELLGQDPDRHGRIRQ